MYVLFGCNKITSVVYYQIANNAVNLISHFNKKDSKPLKKLPITGSYSRDGLKHDMIENFRHTHISVLFCYNPVHSEVMA